MTNSDYATYKSDDGSHFIDVERCGNKMRLRIANIPRREMLQTDIAEDELVEFAARVARIYRRIREVAVFGEAAGLQSSPDPLAKQAPLD